MSIMTLWLPIVVSAAVVWIAAAIIWMVMPWHKKEFAAVADEDAARNALQGLAPGQYVVPYCTGRKDLEDPELRRKFEEGPLAYLTILPNGLPKMGGRLVGMFLFNLVVGGLCAYILTRTATLQGDYLGVFRIAGTVAFIANGVAHIPNSIWFGRPWGATAKSLLDALIYGLLTGGAFGWLAT